MSDPGRNAVEDGEAVARPCGTPQGNTGTGEMAFGQSSLHRSVALFSTCEQAGCDWNRPKAVAES